MIVDGKVTLTGSMNWTGGAAYNSENLNLVASPTIAAAYAGGISALHCRCLMGSEKIGAGAPVWPISNRNHGRDKPEQDDRLGSRGVLSQLRGCSLERLQPPKIVGEVENRTLEIVRRLFCRAFDRVCDCIVVIRLSTHDRIFGPEPPTAADLKREVDHERLVRAFPVADEAIEPTKY
jgi:hypothetical protein